MPLHDTEWTKHQSFNVFIDQNVLAKGKIPWITNIQFYSNVQKCIKIETSLPTVLSVINMCQSSLLIFCSHFPELCDYKICTCCL